MNREIEEQRYGRNKSTIVNFSYIESGAYRKKFDKITKEAKLNRLIYQLAKEMLYHRSGTRYEDMYWIDLVGMKVVASELNMDKEEEIIYSKKTQMAIQKYKHLLTIHTHPNSYPPSIADLNSSFYNGYVSGLVVCHDGTLYHYSANEKVEETYYNIRIAKRKMNGYNEIEAQRIELEELSKKIDIKFEEVKTDDVS